MTSNLRVWAGIVCGLCLCLAAAAGESKQQARSTTSTAATKPAATTRMMPQAGVRVMSQWQAGKRDEALALLVRTQWQVTPGGAAGIMSTMTEQQFLALPASQQTQQGQELTASANAARDLCKYVLDQGRQAMSRREYDKAEQCFVAMRDMGKNIADRPGVNKMSRLVAIAVERRALTELVALYGVMQQAEKQAAAQQMLDKAR